jgi:isocitrate/isopropylmalate dehydrogenase
MMLDWFDGKEAAGRIRSAVEKVLSNPENATPDLRGRLSTTQLTELVVEAL